MILLVVRGRPSRHSGHWPKRRRRDGRESAGSPVLPGLVHEVQPEPRCSRCAWMRPWPPHRHEPTGSHGQMFGLGRRGARTSVSRSGCTPGQATSSCRCSRWPTPASTCATGARRRARFAVTWGVVFGTGRGQADRHRRLTSWAARPRRSRAAPLGVGPDTSSAAPPCRDRLHGLPADHRSGLRRELHQRPGNRGRAPRGGARDRARLDRLPSRRRLPRRRRRRPAPVPGPPDRPRGATTSAAPPTRP